MCGTIGRFLRLARLTIFTQHPRNESSPDNGRNERAIEEVETGGVEDFLRIDGATASYIVLRDNTDRRMRQWGDSSRAYLKMGTTPMTLVPAAEFDALLYLDQVQPPTYDIR